MPVMRCASWILISGVLLHSSCNAPAACSQITILLMSPSMISTLPASMSCSALFLCLHMSHATCHSFFISLDDYHFADLQDLIHCQYCSCCICHCMVSTPSRARFHPILSCVCIIYAPCSCHSVLSSPVLHFLRHVIIVVHIIGSVFAIIIQFSSSVSALSHCCWAVLCLHLITCVLSLSSSLHLGHVVTVCIFHCLMFLPCVKKPVAYLAAHFRWLNLLSAITHPIASQLIASSCLPCCFVFQYPTIAGLFMCLHSCFSIFLTSFLLAMVQLHGSSGIEFFPSRLLSS